MICTHAHTNRPFFHAQLQWVTGGQYLHWCTYIQTCTLFQFSVIHNWSPTMAFFFFFDCTKPPISITHTLTILSSSSFPPSILSSLSALPSLPLSLTPVSPFFLSLSPCQFSECQWKVLLSADISNHSPGRQNYGHTFNVWGQSRTWAESKV